MKELVSYGADPTLYTYIRSGESTHKLSTIEIISRYIKPSFPTEADAVLIELGRTTPKHIFEKLWQELRDKEDDEPVWPVV